MDKSDKEIAMLLTDDYAQRILVATKHDNVSVQEISEDYEIPIVACYRRIHQLEDVGFVKWNASKRVKGKTVRLYKANLKTAHLCYEGNAFKVKYELEDENEISGKWIDLEKTRKL